MRVDLRPPRPADDPAVDDLLAAVWPDDADARLLFAPAPDHERPDGFRRSLVAADDDGRIVGLGSAGVRPWHPSHAYVHVNVAPASRRRGVGDAIYRRLQALLEQRTPRPRKTITRADCAETIAWLGRRGFSEQIRTSTAVIAVAATPPDVFAGLEPPLLGQGVSIHSLDELGGDEAVLAELADLHYAVYAAIHPHNPPGPALFAQRREAFLGDDLVPEALFVARHAGRLVGVSSLRPGDDPDRWDFNFVGVLEDCPADRLMIARALRRREIEYARRHAIAALRAEVDSVNELELAVLADLPGAREPDWITLQTAPAAP